MSGILGLIGFDTAVSMRECKVLKVNCGLILLQQNLEMIGPIEILVIPNVARRMPLIAEIINDMWEFLAIWILTAFLLVYCFIMFLLEGPFILFLLLILALSIWL